METTPSIEKDPRRNCAHAELWLARDGWWYCAVCNPPVFPTEVLDRRTEQETMRLFDGEAA